MDAELGFPATRTHTPLDGDLERDEVFALVLLVRVHSERHVPFPTSHALDHDDWGWRMEGNQDTLRVGVVIQVMAGVGGPRQRRTSEYRFDTPRVLLCRCPSEPAVHVSTWLPETRLPFAKAEAQLHLGKVQASDLEEDLRQVEGEANRVAHHQQAAFALVAYEAMLVYQVDMIPECWSCTDLGVHRPVLEQVVAVHW